MWDYGALQMTLPSLGKQGERGGAGPLRFTSSCGYPLRGRMHTLRDDIVCHDEQKAGDSYMDFRCRFRTGSASGGLLHTRSGSDRGACFLRTADQEQVS